MEARLNLEGLREQVLVELAGIGEVGIRHLAAAAGIEPVADAEPAADAEVSAEGIALEAALETLAPSGPRNRPPSSRQPLVAWPCSVAGTTSWARPTRTRSTSTGPSATASRPSSRSMTCATRSAARGR